MDNISCHSSEDSNTNNQNNTRDQYLRHLNKISHRISKPATLRRPPFDPNILLHHHHSRPPPPPPHPPPPQPQTLADNLHAPPPHQHQPPVYNINKSDFRDVVQKLTGSPAHERFSTPPPIHPPKPQSSRLQRIRPPPLAAVSNRPPPLLNAALPPPNPNFQPPSGGGGGFGPNIRHAAPPLSPLPPFPSVHGAAESPISAYMRYFHGADSDPKQPSRMMSPRWNNLAPPSPQQQLQQQIPPPSQAPMMPPSPLTFGCLPSPRSPYPLLSPGLLFSPTSGQLGFPVSPRLPVASPQWRGV